MERNIEKLKPSKASFGGGGGGKRCLFPVIGMTTDG